METNLNLPSSSFSFPHRFRTQKPGNHLVHLLVRNSLLRATCANSLLGNGDFALRIYCMLALVGIGPSGRQIEALLRTPTCRRRSNFCAGTDLITHTIFMLLHPLAVAKVGISEVWGGVKGRCSGVVRICIVATWRGQGRFAVHLLP
jgi:hypothetical protein